MLPEELSKEELHELIVNGALMPRTNKFIPERYHHIGIRTDIFKRGVEDARQEISTIEIDLVDPVNVFS